MDEYEKLEVDLRKCYEEYMIRFRCLSFLEQQVRSRVEYTPWWSRVDYTPWWSRV